VVLGSQQAIWKLIGTTIHAPLSDPYEAMPLVCRSWSKCVGAESQTAGAISSGIDLGSATFSLPGRTDGFQTEHSAEFNRSFQYLKPFYDQLLRSFGITPAS